MPPTARARRVAAFALTWLLIATSSTAALADGDPANGAKIFQQCSACHSSEDGVNMVGPSLHCVVGRPAGSIAGFDYSPAIQEAAQKNLAWTEANIIGYLQDPHKFLGNFDQDPGARNKMPFNLVDPQQRQDVVAYLKGQCTGGH
jgi:cytochrome c